MTSGWEHVEPPAHTCGLPQWGFITATDVHPDRQGAGSIWRCECGKKWRLNWNDHEVAGWTPYQHIETITEVFDEPVGDEECRRFGCDLSWKHYDRDCATE